MLALFAGTSAQAQETCRIVKADVVALDMPLMFNRLGAQNINGMMYALKRDVVVNDPTSSDHMKPLSELVTGSPGKVTLRPDKRPRPLVLRTGEGDCLAITLTNLLAENLAPGADPANPFNAPQERSLVQFNIHNDNQVAARNISLRFQGTELVNGIEDDGTFVGENTTAATVAPGDTKTYTVRTTQDGAFLGVSYGGVVGGEGQGGTTASGLWAVLNVNADDAMFYRSAVTNEELDLATVRDINGNKLYTADGHPQIDYEARYPSGEPWASEGKAGLPVLAMIDTDGTTVHTAIDAIVAYGPDFQLAAPSNGPHTGDIGYFPKDIYPLENANLRNPTVPNRLEPFREFTVAFHDETQTTQVFPKWFNDPVLGHTLHGVRDSFMINYGSGGIGAEIIANRLGVGPMHDCINCAYEEFFLTFHTVGEVGQVTDIPANMGLENCDPMLANCGATGPKANYVLYPEDPSNVHHSYVGDSTAFRNLHAGPGEQHVFHLHNHQWLFNANDDNSNYLDAQGLGPGAGYAYWINFGGSGNRNKTAGDAIFHCHFYPHFAQGMWEMWRIHDAFEPGTQLEVSSVVNGGVHTSFTIDGLGIGNGTPEIGNSDNRALPDGEIVAGAPTPSIIPLPGRAMAPMPATGVGIRVNDNTVQVCADIDGNQELPNPDGSCPSAITIARPVGSLSVVQNRTQNPGYPFWIAGMEDTIGNRPPTPPLDMMTYNKAQELKTAGGTGSLWDHVGWDDANAIDGWDGGLPRFAVEGVSAGGVAAVAITRLDMSKEIHAVKPVFFPEEGTDLEQVAMAYHAERCHPTYRLTGYVGGVPQYEVAGCGDGSDDGAHTMGNLVPGFLTNGSKPIAGAPFQDPCIDDTGKQMLQGGEHKFFGGETLDAMWNSAAMTTNGSSPFDSDSPRVYKAANVQFDAVLNKLGYHFPQQRVITLWQDVVPTIDQERPPEPMVLRMNTFDCTQYVHSNVVPKAYELDDYQVRTPTDIIGQHIHLPKWDLTSADGSANGWNYEDGTLSPEAVVEIIHAINTWQDHSAVKVTTDVMGNPVTNSAGDEIAANGHLTEIGHPFFGETKYADRWIGARSTMQRWFADPVVNVQGVDRGLGIIFTHDHYGPSTHQQVGLYATVLIEPAGSKWVHNETGTPLYTRTGGAPAFNDGGPTSWQAAILTGANSDYDVGTTKADQIESFREFYFEYTDFQHAYQPGVFVGMNVNQERLDPVTGEPAPYNGADANHDGFIDGMILAANTETFRDATQPPVRKQASLKDGFPLDIWEFPPVCRGNVIDADGNNTAPRPCPEAITADDPGMYVVNYRNESLLARIYDPDKPGPDAAPTQDCSDPADRTGCGAQADGKAGDLAFAMVTNVQRKIPELNSVQGLAPAGYFDGACSNGVFCPPITNPSALAGGDPFTPTARVMDGDEVKAKMQAGGQEEEHTGTFYGLKWLQGGSGFGEAKNSGWRNAQAGGISEQFALRMPIFADYNQRGNQADYLYSFNTSIDGWSSGTWGLLRSYKGGSHGALYQLPNNAVANGLTMKNAKDFDKVCPKDAPKREYDITAVTVNDILFAPANVDINDMFPSSHVGGVPDSAGGSLVYNDRTGTIASVTTADGDTVRGGMGPIHDPTAMMYVNTADLLAVTGDGYLVREIVTPNKKGKGVTNTYEKWTTDTNGDFVKYGDMAAADWNTVSSQCYTDGNSFKYHPFASGCRVNLRGDAPLEPVMIRAAAGECVTATLRNRVLQPGTIDDNYGNPTRVYRNGNLNAPAYYYVQGQSISADLYDDGIMVAVDGTLVDWDETLDLANTNAIAAVVRRDRGQAAAPGADPATATGMTSFNNNLIQPSANVGLYAQLLEVDVTRNYGINVGQNNGDQIVRPGAMKTYQWYAGHIGLNVAKGKRGNMEGTLVATPVEFGGFGMMPADPIKQGQKGLYGAGAVYPEGSTWTVDAGGTTSATVTDGAKEFRDFANIAAKGASIYYADTYPVENILGEGEFGVAEDAQDMGGMAINYGNEAMWLRYGRNPTVAAGNAKCNGLGPLACLGGLDSAEAEKAYHNSLVGQDPQTAVFNVTAGDEYRMHVLMPFGPGRGSTFDLHGHIWQRDPYLCKGETDLGILGKCDMGSGLPGEGSVGSQNLGINPIGFWFGGIESWFPGQHYEVVIPKAGGTDKIEGDYLFRDHMGLGNTGGLWGIVRVKEPEQ